MKPDVEHRPHSEPAWRAVKPRIPDTQQRRQLERQRGVREFVFGAQDGILTTMGIVTGVGVASGANATTLFTGVVALFAGALSMAVGEYQGRKSERDVVRHWIDVENAEMSDHPQEEFAEQVAYYKLKGFTSDEAHMIVSRLALNPEIYFYEMMRDEFGIDPRIAETSITKPAGLMGVAYAAGSLVPIIPYMFGMISSRAAVIASFILALAGLFGIGAYAGSLAESGRFRRGLDILIAGAVVFALSFLAGHFIPPLFGVKAHGF